jgi:hypothetical protein
MERDKKRQTDRHMTRDLECQEFQKRGERKRERERERKKERERHPTDVYASLFVLFHSHSLLSSCSLFTCGSLSLSLSLSLCVCVRMWTCTRMLSFTHPFLLSFSVSLTDIHTHSGTEQNYRCQATTRLWPEKMLKKSLMETRACACELTRTNPRAQKGI